MSSLPEPPTREPSNEELWTQPPTGSPSAELPAIIPPAPPMHAALPAPATPKGESDKNGGTLALAITSLALAIPLTAIASGTAGFVGLLVAWFAIVVVNIAYAVSKQPRRH